MLTSTEIKQWQEALQESKNPLFFYDDDPDGLCSFILLYKMHREGHGVMVKSAPKVDMKFMHRVEENNPDIIFVLDMPMLEQEFVDGAKRTIYWLDHHQVQEIRNVKYFNPHLRDSECYIPATRMAYQISDNEEDLWIAMVGCLGDWYMPDFMDKFIEKYPDLMDGEKNLFNAVYKQPIGKLVRMFSFLLKGQTSEVNKSVKILTRVKSPYEILNQETSQARFLYKRFEKIDKDYNKILELAKKDAGRGKLFLFNYQDDKLSFTSELANELTSLYPDKVILISRKKSGEMKCSLRCQKPIADALAKALVGISGYGGGHPNACGAVIKEEDWEKFLEQFRKEIKGI